jgi:hypothetical protein
MRQNPSHARPLLLTDPVEGWVRQDLLKAPPAHAISARLAAETPAAVQHAQKPLRFSVPPRSDGWQDILMEDSFVFRAPEPANEDGNGLDTDAPPLPFKRKTPFKGG